MEKGEEKKNRGFDGDPLLILGAVLIVGLLFFAAKEVWGQEVTAEVPIESAPVELNSAESSIQPDTAILNAPVGQLGKTENVAVPASEEVSEVLTEGITAPNPGVPCVFTYDSEYMDSLRIDWGVVTLLKSKDCIVIDVSSEMEVTTDDK